MHPANDNNRTIWSGAFVWRRHWPVVLAALLLGIAVPPACTMLLR